AEDVIRDFHVTGVQTCALPISLAARATGGGETLYQMHYLLRYLPSRTAYWIVVLCTMLMLVAIVTGVITHKRIFRDFFTFRPGRSEERRVGEACRTRGKPYSAK